MMDSLKKIQREKNNDGSLLDTQRLDFETFKRLEFKLNNRILTKSFLFRIIQPSLALITRAFKHQLIIPEFQEFTDHIEDIYWKCKDNSNGTVSTYIFRVFSNLTLVCVHCLSKITISLMIFLSPTSRGFLSVVGAHFGDFQVASYIPQLKRMSSNYWGVSICTCDGQRYSIGDTSIPFTIQSCSKPLTYGLALDLLGDKVVHNYVGQEPSGRNFNELILDYNSKLNV